MAIMQQSIGAVSYGYMTTEPGNKWELTYQKYPTVSIMILSGPSYRAEKVSNVLLAQAAGVNVLGYVHTTYGARPISQVKADIDTHFTTYGVQGIFLDEVDNSANAIDLAYYATLYNYIKAKPSGPRLVVQNPGATTKEAYIAYADHIMVAETSASTYIGRLRPDWEFDYPASKFWHVVHGCPISQVNQVLNLSRERNAGLIYITDDLHPNPYNALPTYWDSFVEAVEAGNAGSVEPTIVVGGGGGFGGSSGTAGGDSSGEGEAGVGQGTMTAGGFFAGDRDTFPSTRRVGYGWKLCVFSSEYAQRFEVGFPCGNTTGLNHNASTDVIPAPGDHLNTDGGMNYRNDGGTPGWACLDDTCPYYVANGKRYFEY